MCLTQTLPSTNSSKYKLEAANFQCYVTKFAEFADLITIWCDSHHTTNRSAPTGGHRHVDFYHKNNFVVMNRNKPPNRNNN